MKRLVVSLFLLALLVPATGCYNNKIITAPDYNPSKRVADETSVRLHLLGLVPLSGDVNLNQVCRDGAGVVETKFFINVSVLSIGQSKVYCRGR